MKWSDDMSRPLRFALFLYAITLITCRGQTVCVAAAETGMTTITNSIISVTYDSDTGNLTLTDARSGRAFATGNLNKLSGPVRMSTADDNHFGKGQEILLTGSDGSKGSISLFPKLPFALMSSTLHNSGLEAQILNHVQLASFAVSLPSSVGSTTTLGTGGLLPANNNPGSYMFLAVADPASRSGVVGGWITDDRGSGVVFSPVKDNAINVNAQIDYGRLLIEPGADAETETFAIGYFDDARLGLEAYADAVARHYSIKLPHQLSGYCTWYAEKNGGSCTEAHLPELTKFASANLKAFGFDFVQIDDGWQAGVSHNGSRRDWIHSSDAYPSGMKVTADNIKSEGLTAGLWFEPFAGTSYDPAYANHQDWFAKGPDGKPFETEWGGTCLDLTVPGARERVKDVVSHISNEWGYKLFKMDAFWTGTATRIEYVNNGYVDDHMGEATLSDPNVTNIEDFRNGVKLVRQTAGPDVFLLGCTIAQNMRTFGGAFGLVDAIRVGPDTGGGSIGAENASRLWFLNNRVWYNDPDCVRVMKNIPLDQARENASYAAISGQLFYDSDWIPDLPSERLEILKRTLLPHGLYARPVDVFENQPARIWTLSDTRQKSRRDIVALFNWTNGQQATQVSMESAGLPAASSYVAFDYWNNEFVAPFKHTLSADLPANACAVFAIKPVSDHPMVLSTSRHVTQGMVDLHSESWSPRTLTLSGSSDVIGGDPYELRIFVPTDLKRWQLLAAGVSDKDKEADVSSSNLPDGSNYRVTLTSMSTRTVNWTIRFAQRPSDL